MQLAKTEHLICITMYEYVEQTGYAVLCLTLRCQRSNNDRASKSEVPIPDFRYNSIHTWYMILLANYWSTTTVLLRSTTTVLLRCLLAIAIGNVGHHIKAAK